MGKKFVKYALTLSAPGSLGVLAPSSGLVWEGHHFTLPPLLVKVPVLIPGWAVFLTKV